ncbi:ADOP family duplicated permease [Gaopeijia maritima]|uniref:ADOP family duplicated permease n=1 Tax=Gaopeijia maritima TaxID=3119007 RepID=A0ABU9E8R5_9BACT
MKGRPWWPARLLESCLRGRGAEYLRGDLRESWASLVDGPGPRWTAERDHLVDVMRSLVRWWMPRSVLARVRRDWDHDDVREAWNGGGGDMGGVVRAISAGARGLLRRPGFAVVTVLTLGLGIGATTTILSVVDGVMLRPLPYDDEDRLVAVGVTFPGREWVEGVDGLQYLAGVSVKNMEFLRERSRTLDRIAGAEIASALLPDRGEGPELTRMARVTDDFFTILGAGVAIGRLFTPDEYGENRLQPTLISYGAWMRRFGGDPGVVGQPLPAPDGVASPTVVGVLSPDFVVPENVSSTEVEFWQPLDPAHLRYESRGSRSVTLIGRLASGVTAEGARSELEGLAAELAREHPDGSVYPDGSWFGYGVNGLRDDVVGTARRPLLVFLGAAALLLLISAMNTANLLLVRTSDRVGELSVRRALGAGRATLVTHVVVESLLLALAGGALGVLIAMVGVDTFLAMAPEVPRMGTIGVDGRILALTAAVSIAAGVAVAAVPALRVARRDPAIAIRSNSAGSGGGASSGFRNVLVTAQLAVALVLGIGASVLMHSFVKVSSVDPGFEPEGLVSFQLAAKRPGGAEETWSAWDETLEAVRRVPGVASVAGASNLPFEDPNWAPGILLPGETEEEVRVGIAGYAITPGYFETMRQPLVSGRDILSTDGPDSEPVAIMNRALVERDFGGEAPLGRTIEIGEDRTAFRVVGVVDDAVVRRAEEGPRPGLYIPYTQIDWPWVKTVVRSDREYGALASELRLAAAAVSPIVPTQNMIRLEDRIRAVETEPRFQAWLIGSFALAALLLASVGLYGTLAHAVGRRQREIGVRLALGAGPSRVFGMVLRQGATVAGIGSVVGVIGAALLAGVLERFLFDVPALDPIAFGVGIAALGIVALIAVLQPAVRATRVDVVGSLREE